MLNELIDILHEFKDKIIASRLLVLGIIYTGMVCVLLSKLFNLQIVNGEEYLDNYIQMTEKTVSTPATRGRIYDCNGKLLAYNELSYNVTIQDTGDYKTAAEKNAMIYRLVRILNDRNETIVGELPIACSDSGVYYFTTTSESAKKRFLRDYYGLKSVDDLDDAKGSYPSDISAADIIEKRITYYGIDKMKDNVGGKLALSPQETLDLINIRYTMSLTLYQRYESTTVAEGISNETQAAVLENQDTLKGVDIEENTLRIYNDAVYFSSIIGYIGKVQDDQLTELQLKNPDYAITDTVGRIGIEEYMETDLQGKKGSRTMIVDNVGHIMEVTSETKAQAGNDVYLTIDRDLQVGIYNLLEKQLAGILAAKLVNNDEPNTENTDSTDRLIPIKDAYYQLINNNVLSLDAFQAEGASENEKNIFNKYTNYRDNSLNQLTSELMSDTPTPMSELPTDINAYMYYIYTTLSSEDIGVIRKDLMDTNSDYYNGWKQDTISLRDFIYAGIADNWIDTTKLNIDTKYSDADDIFASIVDYTNEYLKSDKQFQKMTYRYLINDNIVTGKELCLALYDQEVLPYDANEISTLSSNGENYAYTFMIKKISNIEITPAQLALDPCTAGCVVTDVRTGEVRALVSYPGYDNNRLSNTMDVAYYNKLLADQSLPLYNNATQARKAPGSTFKPITAVAGLEEGVIGLYDTITCTGIYDVIQPPMKCWVYPGSHGALNVVGGIRNSCNYFFGEVGHRLATDEYGNYDTDLGVARIAKYASLFGLDHKSGVEITETDPMITTENPEQSAIGQGTHSYANVQLSRYISAVANRGTVFELSVLDKVTDSNGTLVKDLTPQIYSQIDVADTTWNAVAQGMNEVVKYGSASKVFADLEVDIAGKTGTAQETKNRANHAFFVSFAPYSNPQVAVTVNIPYGYSSSNAATVAKSVYRLYFGYLSLDSILNNGALDVSDVKIGD